MGIAGAVCEMCGYTVSDDPNIPSGGFVCRSASRALNFTAALGFMTRAMVAGCSAQGTRAHRAAPQAAAAAAVSGRYLAGAATSGRARCATATRRARRRRLTRTAARRRRRRCRASPWRATAAEPPATSTSPSYARSPPAMQRRGDSTNTPVTRLGTCPTI